MTYVMSDIHGNLRRFESVLKQIDLQPKDKLYVLGDVIDRHPAGIHILRRIMAMPNAEMLLGNHEYMMLWALGIPIAAEENACKVEGRCDPMKIWYGNGGYVTHNSLKHTRKVIREDLFEYLSSLPLNIEISVNGENFKLVHAAPAEKYRDNSRQAMRYRSPAEFAVWDRDEAPLMAVPEGWTVIFGHTPTDEFQTFNPLSIWYGEQKIGIDCGGGWPEATPDDRRGSWGGRLACLRLDDMMEFYSEEPYYIGGSRR